MNDKQRQDAAEYAEDMREEAALDNDFGFSEEEAEKGDRQYDEMIEREMIEDLELADAAKREAKLKHMEDIISTVNLAMGGGE